MSEEEWYVMKPPNTSCYVVRFTPAGGGAVIQRSTRERLKKKAEKKVPDILAEIRKGLTQPKSTWSTVADQYEKDNSDWSKKHRDAWDHTRALIESKLEPRSMACFSQARINQFCEDVLSDAVSAGRSPLTARNKLAPMRAFLNAMKRKGLLKDVPILSFPTIVEDDEIKGRPLTFEEVKTFVGCIASVVGNHQEKSWKFFVLGLVYSGFRLSESLKVSWDDRRYVSIDDISNDVPMFVFPRGRDKNKKRKRVPLPPLLKELLLGVPRHDRIGFVFQPLGKKGKPLGPRHTMEILGEIGRVSGIITDHNSDGSPKFATAHDLRRTFAENVMDNPKLSQKDAQLLMRHSTIQTTLKHYRRRTAEEVGKRLYQAEDDLERLLAAIGKIHDPEKRKRIFDALNEILEEDEKNVTLGVTPRF